MCVYIYIYIYIYICIVEYGSLITYSSQNKQLLPRLRLHRAYTNCTHTWTMDICTYMCLYIYIYIHAHGHMPIHVHMPTHIRVHTHTHIHIYAYTLTYTRTHTYTYTWPRLCLHRAAPAREEGRSEGGGSETTRQTMSITRLLNT